MELDTRTFDVPEIKNAIINYRSQQAAVENQLRELDAQFQKLKTTQAMIQGAIIAFESLLTTPVVPTSPEEPPNAPSE